MHLKTVGLEADHKMSQYQVSHLCGFYP